MSFESNLTGQSKAEGKEWQNKIIYIKDATVPNGDSTYDKKGVDNMLKEIDNVSDKIDKIWLCKSPLFSAQETCHVFHHVFVVVKVGDNFFSIDKNEKAIYIQRSKIMSEVQDKILGAKRNCVTVFKKEDESKKEKLEDLFKWLFNKEMDKGYNFNSFDLNCQGFATRCYSQITGQSVKTTMFLD